MKEDEIKLNIKYEDDGKGKWQSVSARVEVDGDDYFFTGIAGFGETETEAKEDLKNKIISFYLQVINLFSEKKEIEHACDSCTNKICEDRNIFKPIPKTFCEGYINI